MPIRPIDMISIAPRSQEAANQQLSDQNRMAHAQDSAAQHFQKHVKDEAEVIMQSEKTEQEAYRYDAKEKGNGSYKGSEKKGKKKDKGKEKQGHDKETIEKSNFDIRI